LGNVSDDGVGVVMGRQRALCKGSSASSALRHFGSSELCPHRQRAEFIVLIGLAWHCNERIGRGSRPIAARSASTRLCSASRYLDTSLTCLPVHRIPTHYHSHAYSTAQDNDHNNTLKLARKQICCAATSSYQPPS
jgi:hypothetical protein